ncbi:MAG: hypothetical protein HQL82_10765 [Magnetococcales bacterium]|nr:hypothetical protein [Magnetococcales bacterium]
MAIRLIDAFLSMANSGNLYGIILLVLVAGFSWQMGTATSGDFFGFLVKLLDWMGGNELALTLAAGAGLAAGYCFVSCRQRVAGLNAEIRRLTELRSRLMHDRNTGILKTLDLHETSGVDTRRE